MNKLLILLIPLFIGCCSSHEEEKSEIYPVVYSNIYWDILQVNDTTMLCIPCANKQEPKTIIVKDGFKINSQEYD